MNPNIPRFFRAFHPSQLPLWWPSFLGIIFGYCEWAVLKARLSLWLTGSLIPFGTKEGCYIGSPMALLSWWDHYVMGWLFDRAPWPADVKRVLDIGANEGVFGWTVAHRYPGVYLRGYEPNPHAWHEALQRYVYTHIYNAAIGKEGGVVPLYSTGLTCSTDTLYADGKGVYSTFSVTLDGECADLPPFDVVKIDVDGAELDVVLGGIETLRKAKLVLIEISRPSDVDAIAGLLNRKPVHLYHLDYAFPE